MKTALEITTSAVPPEVDGLAGAYVIVCASSRENARFVIALFESRATVTTLPSVTPVDADHPSSTPPL